MNITNKNFGTYIRELRIINEIGQRELSKRIGIAPSYLNDIEKNKRSAPKPTIIKKIALILKADLNLLNDLAGISKKTIAPDIAEYIEKFPEVVSLLRSMYNNNIVLMILFSIGFNHILKHCWEIFLCIKNNALYTNLFTCLLCGELLPYIKIQPI